MDIVFWQLVLVIVVALAFDFINGFHDTANAITNVVSTRVLSPRQAVILAGVLNVAGAFAGTAVATTVGKGIVDPTVVTQATVMAALIGAVAWDLITWYFGIPSSSSHALIGGIVGAAMALGGFDNVIWQGVWNKVFVPMVTSPLTGWFVAFALMIALLWLFRRAKPERANVFFRNMQLVSASFMSFSHGTNDAQKTMGIITMALVSYNHWSTFEVPKWVILACALAMGLGTLSGGWRIIHTMGSRIFKIQPINGFAADMTASLVIFAASRFGMPISTTHIAASAIMGAGSSRRFSAVRWGVARRIVVAWILTLPAAAVISYLSFFLLRLVF